MLSLTDIHVISSECVMTRQKGIQTQTVHFPMIHRPLQGKLIPR